MRLIVDEIPPQTATEKAPKTTGANSVAVLDRHVETGSGIMMRIGITIGGIGGIMNTLVNRGTTVTDETTGEIERTADGEVSLIHQADYSTWY